MQCPYCKHDKVRETALGERVLATCLSCGMSWTERPDGSDVPIVTTFSTGATRQSIKPRYDLIPLEALRRRATIYEKGLLKYGAWNWQKGMPFSDTYNHILEHLLLWIKGDKSEDHLAHAAVGLDFLLTFEQTHPELDDVHVKEASNATQERQEQQDDRKEHPQAST